MGHQVVGWYWTMKWNNGNLKLGSQYLNWDLNQAPPRPKIQVRNISALVSLFKKINCVYCWAILVATSAFCFRLFFIAFGVKFCVDTSEKNFVCQVGHVGWVSSSHSALWTVAGVVCYTEPNLQVLPVLAYSCARWPRQDLHLRGVWLKY